MKWEIYKGGSLKSNKTNFNNYMQDPVTSLDINVEECQKETWSLSSVFVNNGNVNCTYFVRLGLGFNELKQVKYLEYF